MLHVLQKGQKRKSRPLSMYTYLFWTFILVLQPAVMLACHVQGTLNNNPLWEIHKQTLLWPACVAPSLLVVGSERSLRRFSSLSMWNPCHWKQWISLIRHGRVYKASKALLPFRSRSRILCFQRQDVRYRF